MRKRSAFLYIGAAIAIGFSLYSDPDKGLSTALSGLSLIQGIVALVLVHWARKSLFDYGDADLRKLFTIASKSPTGSGLALIAVSILLVGLIMLFAPRAQASTLPDGFYKYKDSLLKEQKQFWPDHPQPALLASLIEQESCISLRSRGCWNPNARLKTAREEGAGFGQITRAYTSTGALRFDTLAGLRTQYKSELGEWQWANVYMRPDLQLRAIVLMSRDNARKFNNAEDALKFGDAAYNGGLAGTQKERRACQLTKGCNAALWFKHVELHCLKSRKPIYGNRNACDINREHVHNVFNVRLAKYIEVMK
jgi:hypothetical protein